MKKERKTLVKFAVAFSAVYVVSAVFTGDIYTAVVNIVLWSCMCFGYNWAKASKILLDVIIISIYAVGLTQAFAFRGETDNDVMLIPKIAVNVLIPTAEIIVLYKSKDVRDYFLQKKNERTILK